MAAEKYSVPPLLLPLRKILRSKGTLQVPEDCFRGFGLAWRLGYKDVAELEARYTHTADLADAQARARLAKASGGSEALMALQDLRLRRWEGLDDVFHNLPVEQMVCDKCQSRFPISIAHIERLRDAVKALLARPHLSAEDVRRWLVTEAAARNCSFDKRCQKAWRERALSSFEPSATFKRADVISWPVDKSHC